MRGVGLLAPAQAGAPHSKAQQVEQGPGLRRSENSRFGKLVSPTWPHGTIRLHHGLPTVWRYLYRLDRQSASAGGAAPLRHARQPYGHLQHPHFGLVRGASGSALRLLPRAAVEGMAAQLEGPADRRGQSAVAGCYRGYTVLGFAPAQAGASIPRSRLINRGPGLRRDERQDTGIDVLEKALPEVAEAVG